MINVVYLVLVLNWSSGTASVTIPQANMKQCEVNRNAVKDDTVKRAYCIVGVMQK